MVPPDQLELPETEEIVETLVSLDAPEPLDFLELRELPDSPEPLVDLDKPVIRELPD
jgi:hypothetical protein